MAMDKSRLAAGILAKIQAANPNMEASHVALLTPYWEGIAEAIITEITENMNVQTQVQNIATGNGTATGNEVLIS